MAEAIFKKMYSTEIKRVRKFVRSVAAKKKIGKSYDVYEIKRFKTDMVTSPTMLMKIS